MLHPLARSGAAALAVVLSVTLLLEACSSSRAVAERYPSGQTKREGQTTAGMQSGTWHYWYADGHPQAVGTWAADKQAGEWRYWWPDGTLQAAGSYASGGQRIGAWRHFHADGQLASEGSYAADRQQGLWKYWYASGARCATGTFVDGLRSGLWRAYDAQGRLKAEEIYYQGVAVGPWESQGTLTEHGHPSGFTAITGSQAGGHWWGMLPQNADKDAVTAYPAGDVDGVAVLERADGSGRAASCHLAHGVMVAWYADGVIASQGSVVHGKKDGTWHYYRHDGSLIAELNYHQGDLQSPTPPAGMPEVSAVDAIASADAGAGGSSAETPSATSTAIAVTPETRASLSASATATPQAPAPAAAAATAPDPASAALASGVAATLPVSAESDAASTPAFSPIPQLPSFWTKSEEGSAAAWINHYDHGSSADGLDTYSGSIPADAPPTQRPDLLGKVLPQSRFLGAHGEVIDLSSYHKPLVICVMRGFSGQVCLYCAAQTVALCKHLDEFHAAGAEVVVLYPGPAESAPAFMSAVASLRQAPPPMPVALDVSLLLVRSLGVEDNLARPTSLVLDGSGAVRYAYVGKTIADRPSAEQLLREVHRLIE